MRVSSFWRRIILQLRASYYSARRTFGSVIIQDNFGIKMRLYPFDTTPIKKLLTRENFKDEFSKYDRYAQGVVIDAGANIGITAVYLSRRAKKVYAFEPVPQTFALLQETLRLNTRANITPVQLALGDFSGTLEMHIFPQDKSGWNSIYIPRTDESEPILTQQVPITTLDAFAEAHHLARIGFLKIDVRRMN